MAKNNKVFTPTFRRYADMTDNEKAAFRQGAAMVDNSVQERLGMKKPRGQKPTPPSAPTKQPLKNSAAPQSNLYKKYLQIKKSNPSALLFYRIGDFYEVFGEDAKTVAKVLDLTLTGRSVGDERIPMCGVPFHTLERYLAKLVQSGYKVAVTEG